MLAPPGECYGLTCAAAVMRALDTITVTTCYSAASHAESAENRFIAVDVYVVCGLWLCVCLSVCLSVCWSQTSVVLKKMNRSQFRWGWDVDSGEPKVLYIKWGPGFPRKRSILEAPLPCDAAFRQNYFDHLFANHNATTNR